MPGRAGAVLIGILVALLAAGPATAATKTVTFDDQPADTRVSNQYLSSHGVNFAGDLRSRPVVKSVGAKAHSGDRVGINSCEGIPDACESYPPPVLRGELSSSANSVSAFVGYYSFSPPGGGDMVSVRIRAFNADTGLIAESPYVVVTEDAAFNQQVTATSPSGAKIDSFEIVADKPGENVGGKSIGFDDLAITIDEGAPPPPPNFTLNQGQTVVDVLTGTSVDVSIDINRINGSNGDISFAVSGLPAGMTASFNPNPVTGGGTQTVMTLSAADGAAHSDQYSDITITATPTSPGAGPSPRSITKQVRIRENCARGFRGDYLDVRTADCMQRNGNVYSATNTEVRVNGLIIKPADDSRPTLVIDTQNKTIAGRELTMPFTVAADTDPDIPIYAGPIKWSFASGSGPREIIGFDLSGIPVLKSLPISGLSAKFTQNGDTILKPTVRLAFWPFNYFGSITTSTTFQVDNDNPPDFSALEIKVANVNALGIQLKDVRFKWQQGGTWAGSAKLVLNFARKYEVGAGFGIKEGSFDYLNGSVSGLNQPIGTGIFLQQLGFAVKRDPLTISGTIGLSGGPKVAGRAAVSVGGTVTAVLDDPFIIEVSGSLELVDEFKLGDAYLRYSSTGLFEFGGKVEFDIWRLDLSGQIDGWVAGLTLWNVEGSINACLDVWGPNPCGSAKVLLSTKGIAGCIGAYGYYVGAGAKWAIPPDFDAFTGCDLSPYREEKPDRRKLRKAAQLSQTTLPKGLPSAAWEVTGANGIPPAVTLTGPNGQAVTVSRETPNVQQGNFLAQAREDGTTFVLVNKPAAGAWTLSDDGAVPVTRVREARGLPKPSVKAKVTGRGRSRVLSWTLRRIPGQRVTFAEVGKDVKDGITTTTTKRGSVRFRPADGPAGKRSIVALIEQDGQPRTNLTVGSYRAPGPPKPGKPRNVKIVRKGSRLTVSWRPNPSGFRHAVYFQLGDKRRIVQVLSAKRRSYTLKGVSSKTSAKVKVTGLTAANGKGPSTSASIKARKRSS
jgi:hypothetical protein